MTTIAIARAALEVPASVQNSNVVQDAQWRLRDALRLAAPCRDEDPAPSYVLKAVRDLQSWVQFCLDRPVV